MMLASDAVHKQGEERHKRTERSFRDSVYQANIVYLESKEVTLSLTDSPWKHKQATASRGLSGKKSKHMRHNRDEKK